MTLTPSPDPPKLYLNEHLSPRLAVQLRRYGFDVLASQESSMLSEDDSQQLLYAVAERRALVTFNVHDFISLHKRYIAEGREHWGIIFSTEEPTRGPVVAHLLSLHPGLGGGVGDAYQANDP